MILRYSLTALLVICSSAVDASQLYRYKDETGRVVMGQSVPPALVGQGYEILGPDGRVLQVVKPALTAQQIADRDAKLAKLAESNARLQSQQEVDSKLRLLYTHPNDAVRMLERRAQDLLSAAGSKRSKIAFARRQIIDLERQAADQQRKGLPVSPLILDKMSAAELEIEGAKADLVKLTKDYETLKEDFSNKISRLEVITKQDATDYPALLEFLSQQDIVNGELKQQDAPDVNSPDTVN